MVRDNIIKALGGLVAFLLVMMLIGYYYEHELAAATEWVVDRIGFAGLAAILLVSDTVVSPFPPDLLLVVIAKSPLASDWIRYVGILGAISVIAGLLGWSLGRWLGHFKWATRLIGELKDDHRDFIKKFGFWAVALGAATPLPYSITCWAAGMFGVRWEKVLLASLLFRVPRMYLYYWLIVQTGKFVR